MNNFFLADVAWTFSLYIEAVAVLPQLHMFQKKGGEIEAFTSHWVFAIGAARLLDFVRTSTATHMHPPLTLPLSFCWAAGMAWVLVGSCSAWCAACLCHAFFWLASAAWSLSGQIFWLSSYHELNDRHGDLHTKFPGHFVVISQIIHLALMVDFFYYYVKG